MLADLDDFQPTAIQEHEDAEFLRVFFTSASDRDAAQCALGLSFSGRLFMERLEVPDEDWAARSQAELRAISVGRILVAPPWDAAAEIQTPASLTVIIKPSMGFGTGHHASTRLSLLALQSLQLDGRRVLDLGTGSGVLAIAAVRLGAARALGVDVDPDALASAAENVELNHVADRVELQEADFRNLRTRAPVVLANLSGALLEQFADTLANLIEPGGQLIASGIMDTERTVIPALEKGLVRMGLQSEGEWVCGVFKKN